MEKGIDQILNEIPQEEKEKIAKAVKECQSFIPQTWALKYLFEQFNRYVAPLENKCSKCRKKVKVFWSKRLEIWKMK